MTLREDSSLKTVAEKVKMGAWNRKVNKTSLNENSVNLFPQKTLKRELEGDFFFSLSVDFFMSPCQDTMDGDGDGDGDGGGVRKHEQKDP